MKLFILTFIVIILSGCTTPRISDDESRTQDHALVDVEAVVLKYEEQSWSYRLVSGGRAYQKVFAVQLEVKSPAPKGKRILSVYSEEPLSDGHVFRQTGAVVTFTTEMRYLRWILVGPYVWGQNLYLDGVLNLKQKTNG